MNFPNPTDSRPCMLISHNTHFYSGFVNFFIYLSTSIFGQQTFSASDHKLLTSDDGLRRMTVVELRLHMSGEERWVGLSPAEEL